MKHLQNNFTIPEQSKRLLELGLPADSADCFYYESNWGINHNPTPLIINSDLKYNQLDLRDAEVSLPCWSVGRLIEILSLTMHKGDFYEVVEQLKMSINRTQDLVQAFSEYQDDIDFSNLED